MDNKITVLAPRRRRSARWLSAFPWLAALCSALLLGPVPLASQGAERGKRSPALRPCDDHFDHGRRQQARACYGGLLRSNSDLAVQAEAYWRLGDFKQANELFRAAVAARPDDPDLRVRWGYLFLEAHDEGEAVRLFSEALKIDENHVAAKLGTASVFAEQFEGKALDLVQQALESQPKQVEGHLLLARMSLEEGDLDKAGEHLDRALENANELRQSPLEVYALKASLDLLRNKTESEWTRKALEYNPAYGAIYAEMAHFYVITRRYREANALYQKAVEIDPELWSAHAALGVNLLREAEEEKGRRHLEIAYRGDPYSLRTVNTLRLLDSFKNFRTYSNQDDILLRNPKEIEASLDQPKVILKLHEKEADVLRPYVMELTERSIATFSKKYGFRLQRPVQVELYPDHDDFAVRTMGMPGLGLLGVTFGYVVAMDSPSGRTPGSFHWGTTLWHEMAHVFTLESTAHLVPRWYSEGISMYEEWEADPGWGERLSSDFLKAVEDDKLLPLAELDRGFIRPRYPGQVAISYFQAGLICQMIDNKWGFSKLVGLLKGYGEGRSTKDNFQAELGVSTEEFDKQFRAFLEERVGETIKALPEWRKQMKAMMAAAREKKWAAAIEPALKARDLHPDYVESGNAYVVLADAYEQQGDKEQAARQLRDYQKRGGRDPQTLKKLATWLDELGRRPEALETFQGLLYIAPGDPDLHRRLGEWLLAENRYPEALREFNVVLALGPLDRAAAHFNLAQAYHKMKDSTKTRRHLLLALEAAPSYRPAQKLLLDVTQ